MNGYRSPFLLYEGYELYRRNPFLLSEIDSFSRLILLFIYRKNAFTRELGMQLTEVMIHEHLEFDPNILRILKRCYETYTENDLLEQIILYMMNHEKYDGESALWYKKGIDQELRINGLYEAYICSIPMEEAENLPEEIKLFFRYPNQLNYERKAMLYALVVSDRIRDSRTYREYVPSIDSFLREQASMQRLDENLAILYQNALDHHLLTAETSVQLSHLFFVNKLVVVRPQAVRVIYYSDALKEPLMAPIVNRIAYLPVPDRNGQIYLETEMFNSGFRPAVNPGLSVSRVGGAAQIKAMKKIASPIRVELAQYRELAAFSQFGSELDDDTKEKLAQGERIRQILVQPQYKPLPVEKQTVIIYAAVKHYLLDIPVEDIASFEAELFEYISTNEPEIFTRIREEKVIADDIQAVCLSALCNSEDSGQ